MHSLIMLDEETELTYSDVLPDGRIRICIKTPDRIYKYRHATCYLPDYTWEDVFHYSKEELSGFKRTISSLESLIRESAQEE